MIGPLDQIFQIVLARHQPLAAAFDLRLDPKIEAGGALRVQIDNQHSGPLRGCNMGEIHGGRRLTDAALDVVAGEDLHTAVSPT